MGRDLHAQYLVDLGLIREERAQREARMESFGKLNYWRAIGRPSKKRPGRAAREAEEKAKKGVPRAPQVYERAKLFLL